MVPLHDVEGTDRRKGFARPTTPPSDTSSQHSEAIADTAEQKEIPGSGEDEATGPGPVPKKDSYESRIERLLYEHPNLQISITNAGKNLEGGGNYIVYTIRTYVSSSYTMLFLELY